MTLEYIIPAPSLYINAILDVNGFSLAGGCADSTLDYLHAWRKMSDGLSVKFIILDPKVFSAIFQHDE